MRTSRGTTRGATRRASRGIDEGGFGITTPSVTVTGGSPTAGFTGTSLASGGVDPLTVIGSRKGSTCGPTDHQEVSFSVDLLGGLRVRAGGGTLGSRALGGPKPRLVLLALLLHRGAPVSKDRLVSLLWGESPPPRADVTLRGYVCALRRKLRPGLADERNLITTVSWGYAIDMDRVDLDLVRYERLVSAALHPETSASDALPMLRQAMALAACPLLPEVVDSEWLENVRRMHDQKVRKDLVAAAKKVAGLPFDSAERWARLALEDDPLDESAWHALLSSLQARGQHADGLRAYDRCRRLFAAELGCDPGPGLQALYARMLRGAHESDEELSRLLEAVVTLHMTSRLASGPPFSALGSGICDALDENVSEEQAFRALSRLISPVGAGHQSLHRRPRSVRSVDHYVI
jgi:SARP family transcriptional regulator, regulator of embCAB operon